MGKELLEITPPAHLFTSMTLQLNAQSIKQAELQKELIDANKQLAIANKILAQKNHMIGSLETDLEHLIDQLSKLHPSHRTDKDGKPIKRQWINRPVPGLSAI